jgi:hypothetical protein
VGFVIFWILVAVLWLAGFFATAGAISSLGERNPDTIGDSFSGDDTVDLLFCLIWPASWPCYAALRFGRSIC